ncbi:hypothetical protein A9P18_22060 [Klebsiella pneumoniae]|uniref:hypothetical protein n=1 Tax=Klebsiella pneumoniae TaxID=573 RepID=UPI0028C5C124|nr:hypothetical protein [Klebsiella pneumoniae]HDY9090134.1 hypothetical protein [Klebsiella pneumoniae]
MTDITELAQRLKLEVHRAVSNFNPQMNIKTRDLKELVEALEKAQRANAAQDDHINQQQDRIDQLEKGHQEAAKQINSWRRMAKQNIAEREKDIAELDAARQRIAEQESRSVTVENLQESAYRAGLIAGWNLGLANNNDGFNKCLAAHTAGIKVEAE